MPQMVRWHATQVTLATKFLPHLGRWSKRSLSQALHASNQRLGVEASDIYFIHTPVHPMPLEHWVAAAAREANRGRIQALGLSNCNADQVGTREQQTGGMKPGMRWGSGA